MDNLVLEALVSELRPALAGRSIARVALGEAPGSFLLLFDDAPRSRLLIACEPALPRIHLAARGAHHAPAQDHEFAARLNHHLTGAVLAGLAKDPSERIVRLLFAGPSGPGSSLVVELLGRSANALLVDRESRVLAMARQLKSAFRSPVIGEPYVAPRNAGRDDPRGLDAAALAALISRATTEGQGIADALLAAWPALGRLAAREIEHAALLGGEPARVLETWLARAHGEGDVHGGFVYADEAPESLRLDAAPAPERLLLSALPLATAYPGLDRYDYPTLNAAAESYYGPLAAGMAFRARRGALLEIAAREARRARASGLKVEGDLRGMEDHDRFRRFGEALLAGLSRAERSGETVIVPDPYDPAEAPLAIPIDPAQSLQKNADRYFQKHRKAERGRAAAQTRAALLGGRASAMEAASARIAAAASDEELSACETQLREHGLAVGLARTRKKGLPPPVPREEGVRIYRSRDGYEILVGKGANENDRLTFKIAVAEDFWLHASGASGAHVIVRVRRGEPRPPDATLREAAELAAFFSKAKDAGRTDVIVTRRKNVRRARGAPRGTVTVKKHETLHVVPRNPFEAAGGAGRD